MTEAEKIAKADLPPEEGAANVAQLKLMLSRKENAHAQMDTMPVASSRRSD
jgi:Flp pilus assembly protein TadD